MIELTCGDILKAQAEALVNTVNCVGVMGRGIALQFKKAFPDNFKAYEALCAKKALRVGEVFVHDLNRLQVPRWIINFPTKRHWRGKSRLADIEAGLAALVDEVRRRGIRSVAVPPLGCGLGGLEWADVRPIIERAFHALPEVRVLLYEPKGAPAAEDMAAGVKLPKMTFGRAALLGLMRRYLAALMDPFISLLEVHKLMYFLKESGEVKVSKLAFVKGTYGPYSTNLRHVLNEIEGHFITGYGDAEDDPEKQIELKPRGIEQAEAFLQAHAATRERFDRVVDLIQGFETPFGMELLATVHWVAAREGATTTQEAADMAYAWNERKRMFTPDHIRIAWNTLCNKGWVTAD